MPADLPLRTLPFQSAVFEAMGTWAHVMAVAAPAGALEQARRRIEQLEARWSRFRPDSEVSRLNRSGGRPVMVSADTVDLVRRALSGWSGTGGRFDPTVLGPLLDAGYDRTFEALGGGRAAGPCGLSTGAGGVTVDGQLGIVRLPAGVGFDPGGIGKGLAADITVAGLLAGGAKGACVNLGGDLRAQGSTPGGGPWVVDVADPLRPDGAPLARLAFDAGGLATSSPLRRRWVRDGDEHHHLIDPFTGAPAHTDVAAVTVLTGDAWRAEVLAKAALLSDVTGALAVLEAAGATGLVVGRRGDVHRAATLAPFAA